MRFCVLEEETAVVEEKSQPLNFSGDVGSKLDNGLKVSSQN